MQEISFRDNILPLKDKLFRLALRITFDRAEAEDIVQDALIKVWNKRDEWGELESIEAYCLTVVRNLAIDRSQKKEAQNLTLTPETQEMPDAQTPESQFERNEQFQLVHRLVNELQASGLPAFLVYDDGLYKVRVGAFLNMDYAVQMERNLRNMGYPTVLVRERAIY